MILRKFPRIFCVNAFQLKMEGLIYLFAFLFLNGHIMGLNFGEDCFTPEKEEGKCIHFRTCSHYTSMLKNITIDKSIPPRILNYLNMAKCGITEEKKLLICCPMNEARSALMEEKNKNRPTLIFVDRYDDGEIERLLLSKDEEIKRLQSLLSLGYELFPGLGYYKYHRDVVNFANASSTCGKEGAHLVILNSDEEANAVLALNNKFGNSAVWTGIIDAERNGKFRTLFGKPLSETGYSRWQTGEPNNYSGNEFCVDFGYNNLTMNDLSCEFKRPFVCETGL